jgi:ABC-type transport system involved in cytochrome bd biosynthesis fused ATPase/permease subunit
VKPVDPRLFRAARSSVSHLAITVLLGTITAVLVVVQAGLLATAVARIIERRGTSGLSPLLVALTIVVSLRATVSWAQEVAAHRASAQVKSQLRRQIVRHATRGAADPAQSARRAEVAALAGGGLDALDGYFAKYLPQLVLAVVVPAVVLLQLLRTDVTATLTVALTLPLIPVFMVLVGKATEAANARRWDALARLSHHFLDVVEGMPTLRAFGRGNAQADLVRESTDQYRSSTMATLRIAFLSSLILETLATLSVALVAVGVGLRLVDGGLDLRTGLLVILLAPEAYLPLRQVGAHYHASAAGLAAADAAFTLLEAPQPAHRGTASLPGGPLVVEMSQISVRHRDRDTPAPDHADLSLRAGEVVCLTGASGSGKTSLLTVLLGLRTADEGTVTLGSAAAAVPLSRCRPGSLAAVDRLGRSDAVPLPWHAGRQPPHRRPPAPAMQRWSTRSSAPACRSHSTARWASTVASCRPASGGASAWPGHCCAGRRWWCSTSPRPGSTRRPRTTCCARCARRRRAAQPCSWSATDRRRSPLLIEW